MKKTVLLFTTIIMVLLFAFSASASNSDFAGGNGTENAPYLIATKEQLDNVRNFLDAHFKLIGDIEFTNDSTVWIPIGNEQNSFTGIFDGNGHSIKNLYVSSSNDYVGLFGYNEGTIKDLSLIDADVHGYAYVGGSDYSDYVYAGTIAGYSNGSILKCCSFGKVYATGTNPGTPTTGTFYRAYVYAGGITGFNVGVVENCYNNCDVTTKSSFQPDPHAGGIAGKSTGSIRTCYNLGDISYNGGGIVGEGTGSSSTNCYYLDNVSKGVGSGTDTFTKCILSSMSKVETFNGFDFTNVWTFDSRYGYMFPVLRNGYVPNLINTVDFVDGCGTEDRPYLIKTKEHLNNVRKFPKAHYKMISDIVFTASDFFSSGNFYNYGTGWEPIGSSDEPFSGFFDGNGHTIKGLYINTSSSYAGLFGYTNGTIQNLGINGCNITAKKSSSSAVMVGSIAGNLYGEGKIINCYNTGNIVAHSPYIAYAGGIVGTGSNIENCYNTGNINATTSTSSYSATYCNAYAGGIVGRGGQISTCYNTGNVTASAQSVYYNVPTETNTGGIAGQGWDIYNSFNVGTISSTTSSEANIGGICGLSESIVNCYNAGSVSSTSTSASMYTTLYAGGIAGNLYSGMIINCYYLDSINKGVGFGTDFCTKCTGCSMLNQSTYSEFDFNKDWSITPNASYPLPVFKGINRTIVLPNSSAFNHSYTNACDTTCNTCSAKRTITHDYLPATCTTAKKCKVCGITSGSKLGHSYTNACDTTCNTCSAKRTITHDYLPATCTTAKKCKVCGITSGSKLGHSYSNSCDTTCNRSGCGAKRSITHSHKNITIKATLSNNGKVENKCSVCGEVSKTTIIYYPKTITLSTTAYTYNGKLKTPTVTVKDSNGNALKKDTDYTVKYESGRKSPGKYTVTITFKGKYTGTKTLYFTIVPKATSKITATQTTTTITLKWNKVTGADGYRVYKYNSKTKKYEKLKDVTGTSLKISKLETGTAFKYKVRAYTKDDGTIWGTYSSAFETATKPATPKITKLSTTKGKASFTWSNISGESGYQVYYSTKKDSGYKKVASYKTSVVKGSKSSLTSGKTYYFKVRAYKKTASGTVYSAWSSVKSIKIK